MKYIPPPNLEFLDKKGEGYYACSHCNTHVGLIRDLESKTFQGRAGRAFLFKHLSNVKLGPGEYRELSTGHRIGVDISCFKCQKVIGWKYVHPCAPQRNFKVEKYVVEKAFLKKYNNFQCHLD